jgi:predicted lipoprotein with Yx(FWY)xxD motif
MLKLISFSALAAVVLTAGAAFAAEPATMTPPAASNGMLVSAKGMTLYTFDKDAAGKSACNGQCATNWPPILVADGGKASGNWTIVVRDEGLKQWAYKGKPVYGWVKDSKPGDTTGDGFMNGVWHVAKP